MAKWTFEPGHTAAEFRARHMMVSYVRGHFKNVHGMLVFDPASPQDSEVEATIDARGIWTGEPNRDAHLRSADFLDVDNYPEITFRQSSRSARQSRLQRYRGTDHPWRHSSSDIESSLPRSVANTLVGGRRGQRAQSSRGLCCRNCHQSSRLWRQLERHNGSRGNCGRQYGAHQHRC